MSGQLRGAAALQQRFRQRLTLFGQSSGVSDGNGDQLVNQQLWPDDPVIDGVKRHLNIHSRIGFEPISAKFARMTFYIKQRMTLRMDRLTIVDGGCPEKSRVQLIVTWQWKSGFISKVSFIIPLSEVKDVLHLLFRRVHKWYAIDFMRTDYFDAIGETTCDRIVAQLLDAILEESDEAIDIRQLSCGLSLAYAQHLIDFVRRCAPELRTLNISWHYIGGAEQPSTPLPELAQALYTCKKLRRLLLTDARCEQFPSDFLGQILELLPQLSCLVLGNSPGRLSTTGEDGIDRTLFTRRRFSPELNRLSIDEDWLQAIWRLSDFSVLNKVQHFQLITWSQVDVMLDFVWHIIVGEMHQPAFVDLDYLDSAISWEQVFDDYLPKVQRTGANVERNLLDGLPIIKAKELQERMASMPVRVKNALTPPDLANAPVKDGRYLKIEFNFVNGAKITFKKWLTARR